MSAPDSALRERMVQASLNAEQASLPALIEAFLSPPVYSRRASATTAYTAVYRPAQRRVDYLWPGERRCQRIGGFECGEYCHDYGELT